MSGMMLFRRVAGREKPEPMWPRDEEGKRIAADGVDVLTVEQAEQSFCISSNDLREMWNAVFGDVFPATDIVGEPLPGDGTMPPRPPRGELSEQDLLTLWHEADYPQLTVEEFELFLAKRQAMGIPRFARSVYPYIGTGPDGKRRIEVLASMEEMRRLAQNNPAYDGEGQPEWCGEDGVWKGIWAPQWQPGTPKPRPTAARVVVYKLVNGRRVEYSEPARWWAYAPYDISPDGHATLRSEMWDKMDAESLARCALARSYRAAGLIGSLYTREEMDQAKAAAAADAKRRPPLPSGTRSPESQIRDQVNGFLEGCQLEAFDLVPDPPESDEDFERQLARLIPKQDLREATLDAFRRKFKQQYLNQRQQWYVGVLAAVTAAGSRRGVLN